MVLVYCFFPGDEQLALKNVRWWNELGGCKGHDILCSYDPRCDPQTVEAVGEELRKGFNKVWRLPAKDVVDGWPEGANYFFRLTSDWLVNKQQWPYFFWMEPDAVPIREGWLNAIVEAHRKAGKPFLGDRVAVGDIPLHMSGVGIYPNPIFHLAGEAYRAHDTAFDMAAKDQIVPNAAFTNLIEHAWKHPTFKDQTEIANQIAPETLLFHSSKDGSLIDLLREKRGGKQIVQPGELAFAAPALPKAKEPEEPGSPSPLPVCDIFIRTYPGDYQWLEYCLKSIVKFCTGFRKVWVVSPAEETGAIVIRPAGWEWKVMNDETEDGYLAQQITKLYADVITDYQPDYILHVDSDVIFTRPCDPRDFFTAYNASAFSRPIWYYTPYDQVQTPWQPIVEQFMRVEIKNEFMRRLPIMIPRWLYPRLRENCHKNHGQIIADYIRMQPMRSFSEFNVLGAFAWIHYHDKFAWTNTLTADMPEPFARQFHSWGGLTQSVKSEIEKILGEGGASNSAVKVLPNDIWVLEGDLISKWIEQEGRLDHDQNLLPVILEHVRPGNTVIDAGAFIGDHTVAYAKAVGSMGVVYAFEPNPNALECLRHNTQGLKNVSIFPGGLSDRHEVVSLSGNNGNAGGAYVGDHMSLGDVVLKPLDEQVPWGADFIKLDVEGYEVKALKGAEYIINRYRPTLVIEVNEEALKRQGESPGGIFHWLEQHQYDWKIIQENCCWNDPLYDILAVPVEDPSEGEARKSSYVLTEPPPQAPLLTPKEEMMKAIACLKDFSEQSAVNKQMVAQRLFYAGLRPRVSKKK